MPATRESVPVGLAAERTPSAEIAFESGSAVATTARPMTLLDVLLTDQHDLSAVERFSIEHSADLLPAQAKYYSRLIPASPPGPGQQYAFDVDLDRCSGCKACVVACHSLNGLDPNETWRDVGLLVGGTTSAPVLQHVTMACHHCIDPGCLKGCPVNAYEKDPVTGIVKHLDDQCFGCQYCTLACPYDVPKFHAGKGIVRKCDMCSSRLAVGEAPACVQSCPHEAISIRIVDQRQIVEDAEAAVFLPAAPDSQLTLPTTTYRTRRVLPKNMLPADYHAATAQHPHWPLIVMLVLTQLSVGAFLTGLWLESRLDAALMAAVRPLHSVSALLFGLMALAASTMHLGRPQYAFRAVIGLKHSWLSREIVAFGVFAKLAMLYAAGNWFGPSVLPIPPLVLHWIGWGVGISGLAGVGCSVMIYSVTRRALWEFPSTVIRFSLTTGLLGIAATWLSLLLLNASGVTVAETIIDHSGRRLCAGILLFATAKLVWEAAIFRHLLNRHNPPLKRSAALMAGPLARITFARFACGLIGGIFVPSLLLNTLTRDQITPLSLTLQVGFIFVASLVGELLERFLFFATVAAPRMPGNVR